MRRAPINNESTWTIIKNELPALTATAFIVLTYAEGHLAWNKSLLSLFAFSVGNITHALRQFVLLSEAGQHTNQLTYPKTFWLKSLQEMFRSPKISIPGGLYHQFSLALGAVFLGTIVFDWSLTASWVSAAACMIVSLPTAYALFMMDLHMHITPNQTHNALRFWSGIISTLGISAPVMSFYYRSWVELPMNLGLMNRQLAYGNSSGETLAMLTIGIYTALTLINFTASFAHVGMAITGYSPTPRYARWMVGFCKNKLGWFNTLNFFQFPAFVFYRSLSAIMPFEYAVGTSTFLAALTCYHFTKNMFIGNPVRQVARAPSAIIINPGDGITKHAVAAATSTPTRALTKPGHNEMVAAAAACLV